MIHVTAIVHPEAKVHPQAEIGPWCTVGKDVEIGEGTRLISHVVVDGRTRIGKQNLVFPFAVLGGIPQDLKYQGEATELWIGDHNTIRESVTINLGTLQGGGITKLGSHCLLMAYVHLGHDCLIGNHCVIANSCSIAGHVLMEDYAFIGGMNGIQPFVRIGTHAYTGGYSAIGKDIPPYTIAVGVRNVELKGANIVGLRRRGFPSDVIQKINESVKLWARPDVPKEQALLEIQSQYGEVAEIQRFIEFIRTSEYGVVR